MLGKQFIVLFFAGVMMVNLGHNIIPHHHHLNEIYPCHDCSDRRADEFSIHLGNPNFYCLAFNGMEYYPAPKKQDIHKPFKTDPYICLSRVSERNHVISFQEILRPSHDSPPDLHQLLGSSSGLRAPPRVL